MPDGAFDTLLTFHEGDANIRCDKGIDDPLIAIKPYLEKAGWKKSVNEYFETQYEFEKAGIDFELLNKIRKINDKKTKCFIGSNQNYHRKAYLIKAMKLNDTFDESYFSCDFKYIKPENGYWEKAFDRIRKRIPGIKRNEIHFFDDRIENIASANEYGFKSICINHREEINEILEEELS